MVYCSKKCQKKDWNISHGKACKSLKNKWENVFDNQAMKKDPSRFELHFQLKSTKTLK